MYYITSNNRRFRIGDSLSEIRLFLDAFFRLVEWGPGRLEWRWLNSRVMVESKV